MDTDEDSESDHFGHHEAFLEDVINYCGTKRDKTSKRTFCQILSEKIQDPVQENERI